jgi:AraC-like DNA-binding protein
MMSQTTAPDVTSRHQAESETRRMQACREELAERIARAARQEDKVQPMKGLFLQRISSPNEPLHSVSDPAFCVITQGGKEILLGDERYRYDPAHYLLVTAELPVAARVVEASPERPYLSFRLVLDPALVSSVMVEAGHFSPRGQTNVRAIAVSLIDAGLLDAALRLVRLLDSPAEAQYLAPLIKREIVYRLLMGKQGDRLRHIAVLNGHNHRIARAIEQIRTDFDQPLHIEDIARGLGMSVSSFHHHFKAVTAMSPLQFQKRLRLQEARRLLLGDGLTAAGAARRVGYEDASHFSREYKRLFGLPPMHDAAQLREAGYNDAQIAG